MKRSPQRHSGGEIGCKTEVPKGPSKLLMRITLFQVVPSTELGPDMPEKIRVNK